MEIITFFLFFIDGEIKYKFFEISCVKIYGQSNKKKELDYLLLSDCWSKCEFFMLTKKFEYLSCTSLELLENKSSSKFVNWTYI